MNSELAYHLQQFLKTADENQHKQLLQMMSEMNKGQDQDKVEEFSDQILNKKNKKIDKYVKFLESTSMNAIITAPTQVGKTNAVKIFIEKCIKNNVPVIVSTDNKTDMCEQFYERIQNGLCGADVKLLKVSDKSFTEDFKDCIRKRNKRMVIFCLDNSYQIEKLIMNFTSMSARFREDFQTIKKIAVVNDEGDACAKDKDTENIHEEQAESHKKWIEFTNLINHQNGFMDLKRVFVTATCENVVMLYKIESADVIRLDTPSSYRGYKDIDYIELKDDLGVIDIVKKEVTRIKAEGTYEVILYCIDRKIVEGHDIVLQSLASFAKCIIHTYNGNGITAYLRTVSLSKKFEVELKRCKIRFTREDKYFTIKQLSIRKFYSICKKIGENCVVTIGKDLMSRGISYVSEDKIEPLTATMMIYKPGTSLNAVSLSQAIGLNS